MRHAGHKPSDVPRSVPVRFWRVLLFTMTINTPDGIHAYRMLAIKGALKLESLGMRRSHGPSALSMVKALGIKARTAKAALPLFEAHLKAEGILR